MPLDTVLCLDTSGSMANRGIKELKKAGTEFLLGIQQTATQTGLRENVAVVEFGRNTRIVRSLSDNYRLTKAAIDSLEAGGSTPMFEGLMEAMKEILKNGGVLTLPGGRKMTPRIILMTDGRPDDKDEVLKAAMSFGPLWRAVGLPHPIPIACVGCGPDVDRELLASIAKVTNGMFVTGEISQLGDFFRRQVLLIRFAAQFSHDMDKLRSLIALRTFLASMGENVDNDEELRGLLALLLTMMMISGDEDEDDLEVDDYPPLGTRVRRGRDWKWGNQDGNGVGTVVKHSRGGTLDVEWDQGNRNTYRHGAENARDLRVVDEPRSIAFGQGMKVGVRVVRGPTWEWGNQDGGPGSVGNVYKVDTGERFNVNVRWPNGKKNHYRYGSGVKDVKPLDVSEDVDDDRLARGLAALALLSALTDDNDSATSGRGASSRVVARRPENPPPAAKKDDSSCSVM
ncbi:uncharacterized protein LOC144437563 [Glandiceps talaboti]